MTAEEVFLLINNLDYEVESRALAPQWSTVAVNRDGIALGVMRHQERPTPELGQRHLMAYPGTMQFTAWPGKFATVDELKAEIQRCKREANQL